MTAAISETRALLRARWGQNVRRAARGKAWRQWWPALICCAMTACGGAATGPEEQVRDWLRQGREATEARDRRALMSMISPAYADARGNRPDDIENMLRFYFLGQQNVAFVTRIEEVEVFDGTAAEVSLTVAMAGASDSAIGFSADAYRFNFELEHDGDDWLLIAARWGQVGSKIR